MSVTNGGWFLRLARVGARPSSPAVDTITYPGVVRRARRDLPPAGEP
jgi:hypothetical protein